jgi:hypothetical protein
MMKAVGGQSVGRRGGFRAQLVLISYACHPRTATDEIILHLLRG